MRSRRGYPKVTLQSWWTIWMFRLAPMLGHLVGKHAIESYNERLLAFCNYWCHIVSAQSLLQTRITTNWQHTNKYIDYIRIISRFRSCLLDIISKIRWHWPCLLACCVCCISRGWRTWTPKLPDRSFTQSCFRSIVAKLCFQSDGRYLE